jgi:hypothetical protein
MRGGARLGLRLLACALALSGSAMAADLPVPNPPPAHAQPPQPAAPQSAPAQANSLAPPNATCQEWTDGCRTCQRQPSGETACSNVGIACTPKEAQCTRP